MMRELLSTNGQGFRLYTEKEVAGGLQWMCFLLSMVLFSFYTFQYRRQTCGWEGEPNPERPILHAFSNAFSSTVLVLGVSSRIFVHDVFVAHGVHVLGAMACGTLCVRLAHRPSVLTFPCSPV